MKVRHFLLLFLVLIVSGISLLAFRSLQDEPLVTPYKTVSPDHLQHVKNTIEYSRQQFLYSSGLVISFDQVSELLSLVTQLMPQLSTRLTSQHGQLRYTLTFQLPPNPLGRYLNVAILFYNSDDLAAGSLRIGSITLSNRLALQLVSHALPLLLDSHSVFALRQLVRRSGFNDRLIFVEFSESVNRQELLDSIVGQLKRYQGLILPDSEFENLNFYYEFLLNLADSNYGTKKLSVFDFLQPLLIEAGLKSNSDPLAAARQNESALMALGLFLGDSQLVKALQSVTHVSVRPSKKINVRLAGRKDLKLHFLYSAIVQILTNRGISLNLGEIKEISDMAHGGSGFSFVDIAADRAGLHFATIAIDPDGGGLFLQNYFKSVARSEKSFFPDISALEERITQREFIAVYGSTASEKYAQVIKDIDARIYALPLFSTDSGFQSE